MLKNLTGYEIDSLPQSFNLTDGHAFRKWSPAEKAIVDRAADFFTRYNRRLQAEIEQEYVRDFCRLAGQTYDPARLGYAMCFTASMGLEIVGNYLRMNRQSVALIEPSFDNVADIFRRHELPMEPFEERWMEARGDDFERALERIEANAICLVTPNNPTGLTLSQDNLRRLARFCRERGKLLILDACFRAYLPRHVIYDQYRIVLESGTPVVVIEDTGKTWPTCEIKAPFFAVSREGGLFDRIYAIYTDFLLHVSPAGIKLVHEFVRLSEQDDLARIHEVVAVNRQVLYESLAGTFLAPCERPFASVAWLRIDHPITGMELKRILDEHGVFVLPGNYFFWHDRAQGDRFIRVALTRDEDMFRQAADCLAQVCRAIAAAVRA